MAIVNLNKKLFEKEIGKINEKMQDRISMFGTPVEEITSDEIQIEVFPNRPDLLSYHGFKRAFLGFLGKKPGLKKYATNPPEKDYVVKVESSLKNIRPYTTCAIIKGLRFDGEKIKEIIEIQEKLHLTIGRKRKKVAIGIYPLEKIKLPITFKALEPDKIRFIPLESDKEMSGLEILHQHQTGTEYAHLLAGKQKFPIFVDSNNNILSMPPIINSQLIGKITEKTRDVFVECSGYDLPTLKKCLNILVTGLADMGGKIHQMKVIFKGRNEVTPNLDSEELKISLENTNKLLGLNLNEKQIKQLIEKMGYDYNKGNVKIPAWRADILHEVDLIEDVAIAYGYENFVPEIPELPTIGKETQKEIVKRKISEILVGLNMLEISNYHLTNKNHQFKKMGLKEKDFVEVEESKTDHTILRKNLTHYLLKTLSENTDSEYPQKVFEIGKIFQNKGEEIIEKENIAAAISPGNFTEVKQILEYFSKMINVKLKFEESTESPLYFINGRVIEIFLDDKKIGLIGEIHPRILKNWKIKMPVSIFEISLENIFEELI
jgi:phenylalanyl-tRNA synthetase beta chain|tara:strand:- start:1891 stop:3531 length:1641 start_codon:yes stop_codon:yes gene_type:complete